jgi:HD-GYP domain-containing protein (c-di-GMP phosphodiesterase class II)
VLNEHTDSQSKCDDTQEDRRAVLKVGSTLDTDVFSKSGLLMMRAGHVIENNRQLSRLLCPDIRFGLSSIRNAQGESPRIERADPMSIIPENLKRAHAIKSEAVGQVQGVFDRIEVSGDLDVIAIESTVCDLMDRVVSDGLAIAALTQIKDVDGYTYCHSVNVCILSMYLALSTCYENQIKQIGIAGALHDLGKLTIPTAILRKNGPLSDLERRVIEQHPDEGVRLLQHSGCGDSIVLSCVQDHHEKLTGYGYPKHKPACEISSYAKLITLADVFDALTTDRPYRQAMSAETALILMVDEMGNDFDPWLFHRFIEVAGSIADQTCVTPDGHVAMRGTSVGASTGYLIQKAGVIPRFDAAA